MKLPSIQYLSAQAIKSFLRFPLSILSSFIAVVVAVYAFEYDSEITNKLEYINVLLIAALGIPIYFCAQVLVENRNYSVLGKLLTFLLPTLALALIYWSLPSSELSANTSVPYIRYTVYNVIAHLLVSFIPYWRKGNLNAFWNYNKLLFIRILTSFLYSGFLYAGLAIALGALDLLFDIDLHYELFMDLFIIIFGFFNTWFFVAGIPSDFKELESNTQYPKGLKIFSQYVLLPILTLYLIILYSYGAKIVTEWSLPKGIVSYLISGVSTLGIFTFLLIYPYGKLKESTWIKKFTLGYYYLLLPLIALLFVAILIRLQDYGFTIKRYIVLLLGIWLTINAVYFIIRRKNIKFIPISLALILGLMSFGPWGIFSLSEKSQSNRLISILETNGIIVDGKIQNEVIWSQDSLPNFHSTTKYKNNNQLTDSLNNEVYSIIQYLDDYHTYEILRPYFVQDINAIIQQARDSNKWIYEEEIMMESMGLKHEFRDKFDWNDEFHPITTTSIEKEVKDIRGYDYLRSFRKQYNSKQQGTLAYSIDGKDLLVGIKDTASCILFVSYDIDTVLFNVGKMQEELIAQERKKSYLTFPQEKLTLVQETDHIKIKMELHQLNVKMKEDTMKYNYMNGDIYLKIK
ncbi:MAG: hypothetical protein ACJASF_001377 [Vicingaceae bacterium]|jgi:hypothetical protein